MHDPLEKLNDNVYKRHSFASSDHLNNLVGNNANLKDSIIRAEIREVTEEILEQ